MNVLFLICLVAGLVGTGPRPAVPAPVTVSVAVAAASPDSLTLLWTFDLADRWHLYGPHRNDTGQPPAVDLQVPDGWQVGPLRGWPVPRRHVVADIIIDHIYEDRLSLHQTVRPAPDAEPTTVTAALRWLVCADLCVPGDTTLTVALPAGVDDQAARRLDELRAQAPRPLPLDRYTTHVTADAVTITVPGAQSLAFIPDAPGPELIDQIHDTTSGGDTLRLRVRPRPGDAALTGLLVITTDASVTHGTITVPVDNHGGS